MYLISNCAVELLCICGTYS